MTKGDFDRILAEEGIDDPRLRDAFWRSRPTDGLDESGLRSAAKKFKAQSPVFRILEALNQSICRERGKKRK